MTTNMFGLDDSLTARDERVAREALTQLRSTSS